MNPRERLGFTTGATTPSRSMRSSGSCIDLAVSPLATPRGPNSIAVKFPPMLEYCRRCNELLNEWNIAVALLAKAVNQLAASGVDESAFRERLQQSERS